MILAVIQARESSVRLPGKVLREMAGRPMLQWVIEAVRSATLVDEVVVSTYHEDTGIRDLAARLECAVFGGELDDVLGRFYQTALEYGPTHIVRITGDCPMMDGAIVDATIRHHLKTGADYTANFENRGADRVHGTDGHDVEVFTYEALTRAEKLTPKGAPEREHVTGPMQAGRVARLVMPTITEKLSVDTRLDFVRVEGWLKCSRDSRRAKDS